MLLSGCAGLTTDTSKITMKPICMAAATVDWLVKHDPKTLRAIIKNNESLDIPC